METSERVAGIIAALKQEYPDALCALHYGKDYELMIAVRLSAQCTDARVNLVTPALFARYPTLDAFAEADVAEVEGRPVARRRLRRGPEGHLTADPPSPATTSEGSPDGR